MLRRILMGALVVAVAAGATSAVLAGGTSWPLATTGSPTPTPATSVPVATASPTPRATSTPPATAVVRFNDPWGKPAQQRNLLSAQIAAIRNAPKGAVITVLAYSISDKASALALADAKRRGAKVRVLLSDHEHYSWGRNLATMLGTDPTKGSYLVQCHYACASDVTYRNDVNGALTRPYQHAKAMAISRSGRDRWVVMVPSGNLTRLSSENQANDLLVLRNDKASYDFVVDRFAVMRKDSGNTGGVVQSGSTGLQLYPQVEPGVPKSGQVPSPAPTDDPYATLFDDITCVVDGQHTRIDIAMYMWTTPRRYLAKQIAALSESGCVVRVIGTPVERARDGRKWDPSIRRALLARGDVELRQVVSTMVTLHTKIILVDGWDATGGRITRTASGSPNFVAQALYWSDELAWTSNDPTILAAERQWIDRVLVPHSRQVH